ncbi:EMI domain containing 1 [Phyllostomus discolor]|uniref:EMI domain containing 1 n=1 Tax=Phyllostomus discolor TaxID=89673 RepID=A0A833YV09_9CHIR|nr:EMI domain containing 1 [Phyllostomus discolor]
MGGPRAWALFCLGLLLPGGSAAWSVGGAPFSGRRNWCSYVVTRTISCHVQNGTYLQRVLQTLPAQAPPTSFGARGEDTQPTTGSWPPGAATREAEGGGGPSGWARPGFPSQPGLSQLPPGTAHPYLLMSSGSLCLLGLWVRHPGRTRLTRG